MPAKPLHAGKVHAKYRKGDNLTNAEVAFGATYFRELADKLASTGPVFHLAFCEAARVARDFESFATARARKW